MSSTPAPRPGLMHSLSIDTNDHSLGALMDALRVLLVAGAPKNAYVTVALPQSYLRGFVVTAEWSDPS